MPAPVAGRGKNAEAVWNAVRAHVIKGLVKKKQEQEADAEVERQRKERERQQKQNVMTLGETREQIQQLETRLSQLKEEKHQLFLQLKKVLNEDDNRRRQLVKESNDMMGMHGYPAGPVTIGGHPQLFLHPNMSLNARSTGLYKQLPPEHEQHSWPSEYHLLSNRRGTLKRPRSPSPPQNFHPNYNYKPVPIPHYTQQKLDDGRRGHEYSRAVLWNKNPPSSPYYSHPPVSQVTSTTVSYAPTSGQPVYSYANSGHPQYAQPPPGAPAPPRDEAGKHASASIFLPHGQQPPQQAQGPPRSLPQHGQVAYVGLHPPLEHGNQKPAFSAQEAEKYYAVAPNHPSGVTIRPATHVPIHGGSIPIQQAPQGAKSGGITSGYPIRGQPSPHVTSGSYQPSVSTPHSVYVSQAPAPRLSYSQSASQQQQQQHPPNHVQNAGPPPPPPHGSNPGHGPAPGQHGPSPGRYNVPGLQREV